MVKKIQTIVFFAILSNLVTIAISLLFLKCTAIMPSLNNYIVIFTEMKRIISFPSSPSFFLNLFHIYANPLVFSRLPLPICHGHISNSVAYCPAQHLNSPSFHHRGVSFLRKLLFQTVTKSSPSFSTSLVHISTVTLRAFARCHIV